MPPMVSSKKYCETAGFRNVLPSHSGAASVVSARKDKWSGDGKSSSSSDGGKYGKAIAPIPLGSLPSYDMKQKPEKSGLSCDKEGDEGRKEGKTSGDMDRNKEELWMDKLEAVIADAKEFLSLLDSSYSMPNTILDEVDVLKDSGESKGQHTSLNTDALTRSTSTDQSLSRKRLKVSSGITLVVQEKNACGTETMPEDRVACGTETMSEDEDDVRISSPAVQEENARGTETMPEEKDFRGTETMSEDEDEVRISSPAVQEENARGTETMSEDKDVRGTETMSEDEDEVRISSPAVQEENARGTETMSEDKDVRGTETMSEDEDEVRISSPAVQEENARGTETMSEDEDEITILSPAEWKVSQLSLNNKNECVKPYGIVDVDDYADPVSVAAKANQPVESFPNSEINRQRNYFTDSGQYSRESEGERYDDASKKMFPEDDGASGTYSLKCTDEHEYAENHKHLINFEIVPCDHPKGRKVMEALRLFKEEYDKVSQQHESEPGVGKSKKWPHYVAAENVRSKGMDFSPDKPFGHIPGIEIGHEFSFRTELAIAGLNNQTLKRIASVNVDCTTCATSVVDSERYGNKAKDHDILIYSSCKWGYKFELQRLPGQPRIGVIPGDGEPLPGRRRNHGTDRCPFFPSLNPDSTKVITLPCSILPISTSPS